MVDVHFHIGLGSIHLRGNPFYISGTILITHRHIWRIQRKFAIQ